LSSNKKNQRSIKELKSKNSYHNELPVQSWSVDDVGAWLSALSLCQYSDNFREGAVDGAFLFALNEDDLLNTLGVEHRLHRKKILFCIRNLKLNHNDLCQEEAHKGKNNDKNSLRSDFEMNKQSNLQSSQMREFNQNNFSRSYTQSHDEKLSRKDLVPKNVHVPLLDRIELTSWVRHQKYDKLYEALKHLPDKLFDKANIKYQFYDGQGTIYHDSYEMENFVLNKTDENGNTLLHVAAQNGNIRISKLLLQKGCDPNHQNRQGQTPGHYSISYQFFDFASWLFGDSCGANDELLNVFGLGPYDGLTGE